MSFRKDVLIVLLIVVLCTILVMQLDPTEPLRTNVGIFPPAPADEGTRAAEDDVQPLVRLTMNVYLEGDSYRLLADRLRQAARSFPHIRVEVANISPEGARSRLLSAADAGELADIVMLDYAWVGEFAAKGHLARWPNGSSKPMDDPVDRLTGWNGYRWIAAFKTDPYVIAYTGSLETASPGESVPRTLDEWAELRARRGTAGLTDGLIYADPEDPGAFISLVAAMGGRWERAEGGGIAPSEDSLAVLDLLFGRSAEEDGKGALYPLAVMEKLEEGELWRRFSEGTLPFVVVPLSELSARGLASRQTAGLTAEGEAAAFWIKGTGFAVSSTAAAGEAFDWLETLLAGRNDPGFSGEWPPPALEAFAGDPELPGRMAALQSAVQSLYAGETDAAGFADMLATQRPAP